MITNKNNTAIAPTYIIIKVKPKNSALKRNNIAAALQNVKIKKRTDSIGLIEEETKTPLPNNKKHKKACNTLILNN